MRFNDNVFRGSRQNYDLHQIPCAARPSGRGRAPPAPKNGWQKVPHNDDHLSLKRASASRLSGEWSDDDYDVLADRVVVGRIMKVAAHVLR